MSPPDDRERRECLVEQHPRRDRAHDRHALRDQRAQPGLDVSDATRRAARGRSRPRRAPPPRSRTSPSRGSAATSPSPDTSASTVIRTAATSMTLAMYSSAPTLARARLEKSQYARPREHADEREEVAPDVERRRPRGSDRHQGDPEERDAHEHQIPRPTCSPNQRPAPIMMKTGANAPMIVASATLVSRNARKLHATSAVKITPPSAHVRSVAHVSRRPVTANTTAKINDPRPEAVGGERQHGHVDLLQDQRGQPPHHGRDETARMPAVRRVPRCGRPVRHAPTLPTPFARRLPP